MTLASIESVISASQEAADKTARMSQTALQQSIDSAKSAALKAGDKDAITGADVTKHQQAGAVAQQGLLAVMAKNMSDFLTKGTSGGDDLDSILNIASGIGQKMGSQL